VLERSTFTRYFRDLIYCLDRAHRITQEEDFVAHTFNRSLLDNVTHEAILQLLDETTELLSGSDEIQQEIKDALRSRLQFRSKFLRVVEVAASRMSPGVKVMWTELQSSLPQIISSANVGKPVPESFSVKVQRKLASTVPPRPIVTVSQDRAFEHLERLCGDAAAAVDVFEDHDSHSLFVCANILVISHRMLTSMQTFVSLFQARQPQPSVYVRTLLQHYLFGDMVILGTMSIRQVLDEDLANFVLPANKLLDRDNDEVEVPTDPRFIAAEKMEMFRSRAAGTYLDIMRTMCQNRCRIRRTLCHTIVDWDNLQLDAEELDQQLRDFTQEEPILERSISSEPIYAFPLSSWAYFYKLRQMEWIVQIGFELEMYQPDELATMYWYVQYLSRTRLRHLERIRAFVTRSISTPASRLKEMGTAGGMECAKAQAFNSLSTLEASANSAFADALSCLFTVLSRLDILTKLPQPYSDDHMRYEVRMKPFLGIGLPELVPFSDLTQLVTQPNETTLDILDFAGESTAAAKRALEGLAKLNAEQGFCRGSHDSWVADVKNTLKACIFANITIATVRRAVEAAGKDEKVKLKVEIPKPSARYHDWWIVPKVVPVP
jgi:hypothetical protein